MSHLSPGLISTYNSLTDKHLAGYFSNNRIRRHLQRAGLITRSGRIVPDKEYRHKVIRRAHQRHIRECLAQAIFHKVLEMERLHQIEIKRKLEEFARRERVHKIKMERSKRYEEEIVRILSPRPPTGARVIRKQHSGPEGEHSESSESPSSSRPNTAPGKMQRPVRLKPIHSNSTTASVRRSSPYRLLESSHENDPPFNCTMEKEARRRLTTVEASHGISPYCLPVINNFVTPLPPATKRKEGGLKVTPSSTIRGRRLRPTTASSGADDTPLLRSSVHQSRVCVNMAYFGKTVHLSNDLTDIRDEVKVFQQHCGGENLCVYKGKLREGETFQFISRRHRGFPFSLTFFLNGLQVERLSSCCEFKHRKGSRLGGRHGHFGFSSVEGASPCYKCIIAMGLDKKPTPPPKRVKEDIRREESVNSPKHASEMETERTGDDAGSHSECETSQPQDVETPVKEEPPPEEDKDYEEDFEADDEGPAEEAKGKKSPSPTSETERQVKEKDASETENDEKDEDMRSHSGSSSSGSDQEESDAEATEDIKEDKKPEQRREVSQEEVVTQPEEKDEPNPEEVAATEAESSVAKNSHMDSAGDSTEIEISDASVPSGSENRQSEDTSGDKDAEEMVEESKQEEEQERAKSVQEKLAEAILKESQCSSEPELSDTSTEEEEESTHKDPQQDNKVSDAAPEKLVTFTEQQQTHPEETTCKESGTGEGEVAQKQEESSETKEQSGDEQEPHENSDYTKDEKAEEDEKAAEDEGTAEKDISEETSEALHLLKEENVAQDDKKTEPLEETPAETTDAETAEKDEEKEEKTAAETDIQHDETGQGAKSREEHESSVSEPDTKTDETAVPDNAEAEAMTARETIEIKAESSEAQEALSYEEAPVTDAEKRHQADSEDRATASETEAAAENSSSSSNGNGETTVEKIADTSEENTKDESSKDDIKEEQISGQETSTDDSHEEHCEKGEERMETSEETDEKEDKQKSEEDGKGEEKQTHEDEITEKRENDESNKTEVEGNDVSKEDEGTDKQENTAESIDNATETKEDEEEAVKITGEEDKVADEENGEGSGKRENDENSECVESKTEESEANGADENETKTALQEKDSEAEKSEKDENENKAEESEAIESENDEEDDEKKDITDKPVGEGEEISETTDKAEKSADVDVNEEADGTKSAEEMVNMAEAESVEKETGRGSIATEKGEIDAENGEIYTGAESKSHEDGGEAQPKDKNDLKTSEHGDEESKTDRPADDESTDVKELAVESDESAKKHEDDDVDQALSADKVEHDAKEESDSMEKHDESTPNNSQPETAGTEINEEPNFDDRKDGEETEQDQNGNKSNHDNDNKEPDLIKKENSIQDNMDEVTVVSSGNQEQSPVPVAVDLDDTASKLDEENKAAKSDIHPHTDENAVGAHLSAADGENGADTEEASKASEEGASVLLKPQAQNNEADNTEQSITTGKDSPEALAREDNTDLVTNWVNMHQSSKFFETFVEPLEDLREEISDTPVSNSNKEETQSTELPRSESPPEVMRMSEEEAKVYTDIEDEPQVEEKTELKGLIPKAETEQSEKESAGWQDMMSEMQKGSKGSLGSLKECNAQESAKQGINEENTFSKTETESTSSSHHSATGKPESVSKSQTDEQTTDNGMNAKQPPTEEGHQSKSGLNDTTETQEKADKQSREVTEITDFTTSKSDDGSEEESLNEEIEGKASDRSISRDRKDLQLIEDIKHTLSKDRLSTFSVDESLFAHSSYPLLTAARAESGH